MGVEFSSLRNCNTVWCATVVQLFRNERNLSVSFDALEKCI